MNDDAIFGQDDAVTQQTASADASAPKRSTKIWPRFLHYTVCLAVLAVAAAMASTAYVEWIVTGVFFGQAMLLTVLAGLVDRFWLAGVWRATLLGVLCIMVVFGSQEIRFTTSTTLQSLLSISAVVFMLPVTLLCLASPLYAMRYFRDWRLVAKDAPDEVRPTIGTSDFLLVVTSIAAMIFMTKVPQVAWEINACIFWVQALIPLAFLAILSFLITVPVIWFYFRYKHPLIRWGVSILWCLSSVAAVMVLISTFEMTQTDLWLIVFVPCIATTVFLSGLAVIDYSGFRLNKLCRSPALETQSISAVPKYYPRASRRAQVAWVFGTLFLAATSSIALAAYESSRTRYEIELSELAAQLRADGGDLLCVEGKPFRLTVGKSTTDESMQALSKHSTVQQLILAHSQITDQTLSQLARWYPTLNWLDLGYTNVTPQGLEQLESVSNLYHLGLAGSKMDYPTLMSVFKHLGSSQVPRTTILDLDLSETRLTPEEITKLPKEVVRLKISNCNFDDDDIATITESRDWAVLDISKNPITGSGIRFAGIQHLVAHDVPLQDKYFIPVSCTCCDLSNTQLTDAALKACASMQVLKLGSGQFTDQGVRTALGYGGVRELYLSGDQFNGTCLVPRQSQQSHISLSKSSINDQVLAKIAAQWKEERLYVNAFSLADTQISDKGLRELSGCQIYYLDLSRTRVTAKSIAELELLNGQAIHVDFNQFTADELRQMRTRHKIVVGEKMPSEQ